MKKIRFPGNFCVGSDILKDVASMISCYGKNVVFIGGKRALGIAREPLERGFAESDMTCSFVECGSVASLEEIARVEQMPVVADTDIVCAVGGGSCMDMARTVGIRNGKALVMIPTTVASDAPCSCVSVFYAEDGSAVVGDQIFHRSPDMILVDEKVIAQAPARHLAAGMADALATFYEGTTCKRNPKGTEITETAMMMAELCRDLVLENGLAAMEAVKHQVVTPQLEQVIEANCLLSGTGGMNTGCAAAHGIGDYLCCLPKGHEYMHGERVFVGLLIQLILEQYPQEEIEAIMDFGDAVGLPLGIGDLGVEDVPATAVVLAKGLQNDHFMVNLCCDYSEDILAGAIVYAQTLADARG